MSHETSISTIATKSLADNPAANRAPRRLRPPSDRDLEIYKRVKIVGLHHWEVAQQFEIDRTRVSQIVKRVTRWLAAGGQAVDPLIRDHAARQRLAQGDLKMRLHQAIQMASHALQFRFPLETTRRRIQGVTEVWREETKRDVPFVNLTALRLILDATKSLERLEQNTNPKRERGSNDSSDANLSENELLRAVFDFLCGCRSRAQSSGRLPVTENMPSENIPTLIAQSLTSLVGLPPDHFAPILTRRASEANQTPHQTLTVSDLPTSLTGTTAVPATTSVNPAEQLSPEGERSP